MNRTPGVGSREVGSRKSPARRSPVPDVRRRQNTPLPSGRDSIPDSRLPKRSDATRPPTPGAKRPPISLTFDDGPDSVWTPRVLEALREAEARATFFVLASEARKYPEIIRETVRGGHEVELHCTEHVRHAGQSPSTIEADARFALRLLRSMGIRPGFWRPPWGVTAPCTGQIADKLGLEVALWTADTRDWRGDPAAEMMRNVGPKLEPGAVVLMHDGLGPGCTRAGCHNTADLVGPLVEKVRETGCEPAPVWRKLLERPGG